jgi:hypothetical protein
MVSFISGYDAYINDIRALRNGEIKDDKIKNAKVVSVALRTIAWFSFTFTVGTQIGTVISQQALSGKLVDLALLTFRGALLQDVFQIGTNQSRESDGAQIEQFEDTWIVKPLANLLPS